MSFPFLTLQGYFCPWHLPHCCFCSELPWHAWMLLTLPERPSCPDRTAPASRDGSVHELQELVGPARAGGGVGGNGEAGL